MMAVAMAASGAACSTPRAARAQESLLSTNPALSEARHVAAFPATRGILASRLQSAPGSSVPAHSLRWRAPGRSLLPPQWAPAPARAVLPVDPWAPGVDSQSIASSLFAASLFPYLGFLFFLTRAGTAPRTTLFGFYFLLAFVGATIPAGIYAKIQYGTSLSNVDYLHGGAESLLTITNLLIVLGLRGALRQAAAGPGPQGAPEEGGDAKAEQESGATRMVAGNVEPTDEGLPCRFRAARPEDMGTIQRLVLSEFMNPLALDWQRFVVAEAPGEPTAGAGQEWRLVGVAQVKRWPPRGEGADSTEGGGEGGLLELRSLVVVPEARGRGIGSSLVRELLKRIDADATLRPHPVYLLTIGRRVSFYTKFSFEEVPFDKVPQDLKVELSLGQVVARLAAQDRCLCMKRLPSAGA